MEMFIQFLIGVLFGINLCLLSTKCHWDDLEEEEEDDF